MKRNRRNNRYKYNSDPLRAARRNMGVGSVPHKKWRGRKRVRTGRILLVILILAIVLAAVEFLLRPMYIRTQQSKITDALVQAYRTGQPVFVEPDALLMKKDEQAGSPVYEEKQYAERETVGLVSVGILTMEQKEIELPVVEGVDTVHLRYAIGTRELVKDGMQILYGRAFSRGDKLFTKLDSLYPGNAVTLTTAQGEVRFFIRTDERVAKDALDTRIEQLAKEGETDLLLVTVDRETEEGLLLILAMREERYEQYLAEEAEKESAPVVTPTPENTPDAEETPAVEETPSAEATATPSPEASPTPSPTPTPKPKTTRKPSVKKTPTPAPTEEPAAEPTPKQTEGYANAFEHKPLESSEPKEPPKETSAPEASVISTPRPVTGGLDGFGGE